MISGFPIHLRTFIDSRKEGKSLCFNKRRTNRRMEVRRSKGSGCKVGLQNGKPQQCRIIVRTRDLPPVALLLSQRAAEVAMVTDRRKPEPTLPFSWMQAPDVSLSCVKWFSCTVLQLLLLLLLLFFFLFFSFLFFFRLVSNPCLFALFSPPLLKLVRRHQSSTPPPLRLELHYQFFL